MTNPLMTKNRSTPLAPNIDRLGTDGTNFPVSATGPESIMSDACISNTSVAASARSHWMGAMRDGVIRQAYRA
jgi:hypothetical protein